MYSEEHFSVVNNSATFFLIILFLTLLDAVIGTVLTDVIDNWLPLETIFVMPFSYAFGITYVQEEMRAMAKVVNLAKKIIIIIIMSCHTSRCIRPSCCLTNIFCLVQLLWLFPSSSSTPFFVLSQQSFFK